MFRTILVPLDGSPRAEAILPYVEQFAKGFDTEIVLLRVFEPDFQSGRFIRPPTGILYNTA
jgi:nucleotide-binding universal stress UspA family protein